MISRFNPFKKKESHDSKDPLNVTFVARNELIEQTSTPPQPAKNFLPEWYKDMPMHYTKAPTFENDHGSLNNTVRHCMPFFDSWTMGYIMTTPCDIYVEKGFDGESVNISSPKYFDVVGKRGAPNRFTMPIPQEYYQTEFTWQTHWEANTPEGYSSLYTHPINRPDLPFYSVTGVMDTDKWWVTGNHPFFIKKGFEGIIPIGTPMLSIIPFKRESWTSDSRHMPQLEYDVMQSKVRKHAASGYKKECWARKDFT